ncbi:MAG TPA: glycosyltransferase family 2 protein [Burkholderiaceae bacterium]
MHRLSFPHRPAEPPELSIVVPTLDEAGNVEALLRRIAAVLRGVAWEVIVVDDASADGTPDVVRRVAADIPGIRCLERRGRRGLSSACLEGMALARGRFFAVMDADLQHDERLLPPMLRLLRGGTLDLAVGSRYVAGGASGRWSVLRRGISRCATRLAQGAVGTELRDPMSGFFMVRADRLRDALPRMTGLGFKLLLDLLAASPRPLRTMEIPYHFECRVAGRSKLGPRVVLDFLRQVSRAAAARGSTREAFGFCLAGAAGVGVHLAVLVALRDVSRWPFAAAQTLAVLVAMACNFQLNNRFTFRSRRLRGREALAGLRRFSMLCSIGAVLNVAVAEVVHLRHPPGFLAAIAGMAAGALWNYGAATSLVWPADAVQAMEPVR